MGRRTRTILHVDMDAFFAAVEQQRHPHLRGRPVVVGGRGEPHERGVVSTASYEARRYGIRSGMALAAARRRAPQAVFLPVDFPLYARISRRIHTILREFSRHVEPGGIDEAFLDVTNHPQPAEAIARRIKARVREETGLTCSIGIGPNKLLAKIASDLEKPDGLTHLPLEAVPSRLWPLQPSRLWGVGPKSEAKLAAIGIRTVGELAATPLAILTAAFGDSYGHYLERAARGIGEDRVVATRRPRRSVGQEITFQHDLDGAEPLRGVLSQLARRSAARLRQYHYRARTVTVRIRFSDFRTLSRSLTLPEPTDANALVEHTAAEVLARLPVEGPVRLLGVRLSKLEPHPRPTPSMRRSDAADRPGGDGAKAQ